MATADMVERRPSTSCLFSELDRDNKGKLTKDDILHFLGDQEQIDEVFKVLDADGDGLVSPEDFETGFIQYVQRSRTESRSEQDLEKSVGSSSEVSKKEEHFEYDPETSVPNSEFSTVLDTFEDGKPKLLNIWKKLGETKPELREDFERFVYEIGEHVVGAKVAVKKFQVDNDRKVLQLNQEMEEAILHTELRVRSQSFHSLRAKEDHFKLQLKKKSLEMESMRREIVEMQSEASARRGLKSKLTLLEEDNRELERMISQRSTDTGPHSVNENGSENLKQPPKTGAIMIAQLPPGVEAAVGQGAKKFLHDFKFHRDSWNRTNVISPKARRSSSITPPENLSSASSRESSPPEQLRRGSFNTLGSTLGRDVQYWAENGRRRSSPDVTMTTVSRATDPRSGETPHQHSSPVNLPPEPEQGGTESQQHQRQLHFRRENSPSIHIESFEEIDHASSPRHKVLSTCAHATSTSDGGERGGSDPVIGGGGGGGGVSQAEYEKFRNLDLTESSSSTESASHHRRPVLERIQHVSPQHQLKRNEERSSPQNSPHRIRTSSLSRVRSNSFSRPSSSTLTPCHSTREHHVRSVTPTRSESHPKVQFIEKPTHSPDYQFKILIIGNSGVGKSAYLIRLTENAFSPSYSLTIGVDFKSVYSRVDDKLVFMRIWDTAGQERFQAVTKSYYHGADGIILMYDLTQEHTFLAVREWIDAIKDTTGGMPPAVLLLGNKLDKIETASDRGVTHEAGETMAKIFGARFLEISAKSGQNVADAYNAIARLLIHAEEDPILRSKKLQRSGSEGVTLKQAQTKKTSACCGRQ